MQLTESADNSWKWAVSLTIIFAMALAPTLGWLQFGNSMENLNVATALELRRDRGPWLVPTLEGLPRYQKPPLTAWITAGAIQSNTLSHLDDRDDNARAAAYEKLAIEVRVPALLASALILLATFALGRSIIDARAGLIAAGICASNFFFLRFARFTTTDVQLTLWVTIANIFIARAVLDAVNWKNCIIAAIALGLAFMTKGPVALVQSIVPAIIFIVARSIAARSQSPQPKLNWRAIIVSTIIMLCVALWWYIIAVMRNPHVLRIWLTETNPGGADPARSDVPFVYLILIPFFVPWVLFLIDGVIRAFSSPLFSRAMYPAFVLMIVMIVMTCFHDRKDRYILPMLPFASIVAAQSVIATLDRARRAFPVSIHWIILVIVAFSPFAGTSTRVVKTIDGLPWFSIATACIESAIAFAILLVGFIASRKFQQSWIATTVAMMLALQVFAVDGYSKSREGRSEFLPLAQAIRHAYPDALMYNWRRDGQMKRASVDLSIYLNRITKWIPDPGTLENSGRPQIYVALQNHGETQPTPPEGWKYFDRVKRDKDWYVAFVRESSAR